MRQPKQKRGLVRRATILLAAMAAGSLPMLTPQWMTQLAAAGYYGYGVYNTTTEVLSFSEIVLSFVGPNKFSPSVQEGVFEVKLQNADQSSDFAVIPSSLKFLRMYTGTPPDPVRYIDSTRVIDSPYVKVEEQVEIVGIPTDTAVEWWYKDVTLGSSDANNPLRFNVTGATSTPSGP
jgi:hypothetical protein